MKKYIDKVLFLLFALILFASCNPAPPETVAVNLFNALTSGDMSYVKENLYFEKNMDYNVVCEYLDIVVKSKDYKERTADYSADYEVDRVVYEGDVAWVELQGMSPMGKRVATVARMVMVDGKWKVDGDYTVLHSFKSSISE